MSAESTESDNILGIGDVCAGGCGGRLADAELARVLEQAGILPRTPDRTIEPADDRVLIDHTSADDAAVVRFGNQLLVLTVDVGYPTHTSAYTWGRIAAANALSDIYAMGGRPLHAMPIVGYPREGINDGSLARICMGGQHVVEQAGALIVGGHSMASSEPFYGLSVTGVVNEKNLITHQGGRPGYDIVITKPIGSGLASSQILDGTASEKLRRDTVGVMTSLNDVASEVAVAYGVHTGTDVTGSGLLGHLHKMVNTAGVGAELHASQVPVIPGILTLARNGLATAAGQRNLRYANEYTKWESTDVGMRKLLTDPQTSGGLLLLTPNGDALVSALRERGIVGAANIGKLVVGDSVIVLD